MFLKYLFILHNFYNELTVQKQLKKVHIKKKLFLYKFYYSLTKLNKQNSLNCKHLTQVICTLRQKATPLHLFLAELFLSCLELLASLKTSWKGANRSVLNR